MATCEVVKLLQKKGAVEQQLAGLTLSTEAPLLPVKVDDEFEKRGVKLVLLQKLCSYVTERYPDKTKWSVAEVKNEVIGSHEILRSDYW